MTICSTFVIVKMSILRYEKSSAKYLTDNLISKLCAGSICHRASHYGDTSWCGQRWRWNTSPLYNYIYKWNFARCHSR